MAHPAALFVGPATQARSLLPVTLEPGLHPEVVPSKGAPAPLLCQMLAEEAARALEPTVDPHVSLPVGQVFLVPSLLVVMVPLVG